MDPAFAGMTNRGKRSQARAGGKRFTKDHSTKNHSPKKEFVDE